MNETNFTIELNLQTVSMVSLVTKLWDAPDIKTKISKYFLQEKSDSYTPYKSCYRLARIILERLNSIEMPSTVLIKVQKMVVVIGGKIYDWIWHVTEVLDLDFSFTEKIYWSSYGTIDEVKIFDLYWKDKMSAPGFSNTSKYFSHLPVFSLACMYGHEMFIQDHLSEMIDELEKLYPSIRTSPTENEIYNTMSVSIFYTLNGDKKFDDNAGRPLDMYKMCLDAGFSKAATFYWNRLDEIEKVSDIPLFISKLRRHRHNKMFQEKSCEMFFFLINEMQEERKRILINVAVVKLIPMLLHVWPYQEFIWTLLDYDWMVDSRGLFTLLHFIIKSKGKFNETECPIENRLYFQILETIWGKLSGDCKLSFLRIRQYELFLYFDVPTLNLILNDRSLQEVDKFKHAEFAVRTGCADLVKRGRFDLIEELMEKVLLSNKPKTTLKDKCSNFLSALLNEGKFEIADRFMDWLADSCEEKTEMKNGIVAARFCMEITERLYDFELVEKFLKWRFKTDEGVNNFKESLKSGEFLLTALCDFIRIKSGDFDGMNPEDYIQIKSDDLKCIHTDFVIEMEPGSVKKCVTNESTGAHYKIFKGRKPGDHQGSALHARSTAEKVVFIGRQPGDFVLYNICKIWNEKSKIDMSKNLETVLKISTALINFYYETEEEAFQFKKNRLNIIDNPNFIAFIFKTIFKNHASIRYEILDEFLKFCLIPSVKVEEMKTKFREEIEKWIHVYMIEYGDFDLTTFAIDWLYDATEEGKKREIVKNFLNSSNNGALLCNAYLNTITDNSYFARSFLSITADWLTMVEDMTTLKTDLRKLRENPPIWFISLLDKLAVKEVASALSEVRSEYFGPDGDFPCRGPKPMIFPDRFNTNA